MDCFSTSGLVVFWSISIIMGLLIIDNEIKPIAQ